MRILLFLTLLLASVCANAAGVERLLLDEVAYKPYLERITHSQALTIKQLQQDPDSVEQFIGKRVTLMGFVVPVDGAEFFNRGWLQSDAQVAAAVVDANAFMQFYSENKVQYKPFEVYQVTGVLDKGLEDNREILLIRAQYAEPQGSLSKIAYEPDLRKEGAALPQLRWDEVALARDEIGDLVVTDPAAVVIPQRLKDLEGQLVQFETWLLDPEKAGFSQPASGSFHLTYYVINEGSCLCCGVPAKYDMGSVAMLEPESNFPERVLGGIFIGRVRLNAVDNYAEQGLFTITEGRLVRPLSPPDIVMPAGPPPKLSPEEILPGIFRNAPKKMEPGKGH